MQSRAGLGSLLRIDTQLLQQTDPEQAWREPRKAAQRCEGAHMTQKIDLLELLSAHKLADYTRRTGRHTTG